MDDQELLNKIYNIVLTESTDEATDQLFCLFMEQLKHRQEATAKDIIHLTTSLVEEDPEAPLGAFSNRLCGDIELKYKVLLFTGNDEIDRWNQNKVDIKNKAAAELGKLGGSVKSEKKAKAVRENGKKGGRPKKNPELLTPTLKETDL